jgi:hypothetical protein
MIRLHAVVLLLCVPVLFAQDKKDPPITQKIVLENQFVRVLELRYPPGVFESKHSHAAGVTIALSDYENETKTIPEGKVTRRPTRFGEIRWAEAVTHEARNTGSTEQRVIRIELKPNPPAPEAGKTFASVAALDPVQLLKSTVTPVLENQYVRVIESRSPAGSSEEPRHRHIRGVTVALSDSEIETTSYPGGIVARQTNKLGDVRWVDWREHAGRNVGKSEARIVIVEVK